MPSFLLSTISAVHLTVASFFVLPSGGQLVEDVLTMGVSAKLMHFLRVRVHGDVACAQKDSNIPLDTKHPRSRDENRSKSRLVQDSSRLDGMRSGDGISIDPTSENCDNVMGMRHAHGERWIDDAASLQPERADSSLDLFDAMEAGATNDRTYSASICDTKSRVGERLSALRPGRDEEMNENTRDDLLKRKLSRTGSRLRGKSKAGESLPESERTPLSPTSGLKIGTRTSREKNMVRIEDANKAIDVNNSSPGIEPFNAISKEEYEDRFKDCIIGLKDISDIVLKAVRAAEAEARSANAPDEAVKAAGDAAAELVKSAASEVWKRRFAFLYTDNFSLSHYSNNFLFVNISEGLENWK